MNSNIEQITHYSNRFSNFEIFSSVLRGYNIDLQQLDRGSFSGKIQQIQCGNVFINRIATTRRLEAFGSVPAGLITFGIPTDSCLPFIWRNKYSKGNTLQIHKQGSELEMTTHPFFEAIDVSISEESFNILLQHWELPELNEIINKREMLACDPVKIQQLRSVLRFISHTLENNPELLKLTPELQNIIQYEVPYLLAQTLINAEDRSVNSPPKKRNIALKIAVEYIKSTPRNFVSFNKFSRDTGINERTLQRAFLEQYGIAPKSYAQAYYLNSVYKALIKSNPADISISEIASSFGFSHMSQFAKDYRRHFGELPSETLKGR